MTGFELREAPIRPAQAPAGPILPDGSWSPLECWIWDKLQAGAIANVDEYEDDIGRLPPADPKKPEDWQDARRRLAPRFLEDLLLREPYRPGLHRWGVRIEGAWFDDEIDLSMAELAHTLWLDRCRFEKRVQSTYLRTPVVLSFERSTFAAEFHLNGAKVGGQVTLTGAKVAGTLHMDAADIGHSLFMESGPSAEQRAEFDDVVLRSAKVGGQVSLSGAKVGGTLDMDSADIGQSLLMGSGSEQRAEFNDVVLNGAKVGGQVDLTGAKVAGTLDMDSADIGDSLFMRSEAEQRAEFDGDVSLFFAEIGRNLDVRGAVLSSLDLTGTNIGGELRLASG